MFAISECVRRQSLAAQSFAAARLPRPQHMIVFALGVVAVVSAGAGAAWYYYRRQRITISDNLG